MDLIKWLDAIFFSTPLTKPWTPFACFIVYEYDWEYDTVLRERIRSRVLLNPNAQPQKEPNNRAQILPRRGFQCSSRHELLKASYNELCQMHIQFNRNSSTAHWISTEHDCKVGYTNIQSLSSIYATYNTASALFLVFVHPMSRLSDSRPRVF